MKKLSLIFSLLICLVLSACSTKQPYDYTNYLASQPRSILVLLPTDVTNEMKASSAVYAHAITPLAEAGYYVFPQVAVYETFNSNGVTQAQETQNIPLQKLRDIFGADAALYINIEKYGTNYVLLDSVTSVSITGKLVDLRNGKVLWEGEGFASDESNNSSGGLLGQLIVAVIKQIANTVTDKGYKIAAVASNDLLKKGVDGGILYGPYHPQYGQDPQLTPSQ